LELERRAARARLLAREAPKVSEPLLFAAGLYAVQAKAAEALDAAHVKQPLSGRLGDDGERLDDGARAVLRYVSESAPEPLAEAAASRRDEPAATARTRLLLYWSEDRTDDGDYLSRAVLRPYAGTLRRWNVAPDRLHRKGRCPFCGGSPWVGLRRDGAEMEGARRFLVCALCGGEWSFSRVLCPACFEEEPARLPSYAAEAHPAVRIETCETCRRYVKSIDLSQDARPIPEVDDLVTLSLDLWAAKNGFTRIEPGLAGL
jgi:formate dehydrogenase maturation protein FdhE